MGHGSGAFSHRGFLKRFPSDWVFSAGPVVSGCQKRKLDLVSGGTTWVQAARLRGPAWFSLGFSLPNSISCYLTNRRQKTHVFNLWIHVSAHVAWLAPWILIRGVWTLYEGGS